MRFTICATLAAIAASLIAHGESNVIALPGLIEPAHKVGSYCRCALVQDSKCWKSQKPLPRDVAEDTSVTPCRRAKCESWVRDEAGKVTCVARKVEFTLKQDPKHENTCIVVRPKNRTYLVPYTAGTNTNKPFLDRPTHFSFKFACAKKCWVFHGADHLMDTEDASAINTLSSLPVKNCKPLKIKCVDTTLRFDAKSKSQFPGPVLMGWFQAGGLYHGTGEYVGSDNAVSCKRTLTKFFTDEYDARRLVLEEGFTPNVASPAQQDAIFAKYPTWRAEFLNSQGQLIAKPFTVSPPFDNGQMATFVLTPPYCAWPYKQ